MMNRERSPGFNRTYQFNGSMISLHILSYHLALQRSGYDECRVEVLHAFGFNTSVFVLGPQTSKSVDAGAKRVDEDERRDSRV